MEHFIISIVKNVGKNKTKRQAVVFGKTLKCGLVLPFRGKGEEALNGKISTGDCPQSCIICLFLSVDPDLTSAAIRSGQ